MPERRHRIHQDGTHLVHTAETVLIVVDPDLRGLPEAVRTPDGEPAGAQRRDRVVDVREMLLEHLLLAEPLGIEGGDLMHVTADCGDQERGAQQAEERTHDRQYDRIPHNVTTSRAKAAVLGLALVAATASAQARAPYLDPTVPVERRIDDLLSRMTLEEKVGQMLCLWQGKRAITDREGRFDPARAPKWFRIGVGRIERPGAAHGGRAETEFTDAIQPSGKGSTRL